jgi:hypothetical protein
VGGDRHFPLSPHIGGILLLVFQGALSIYWPLHPGSDTEHAGVSGVGKINGNIVVAGPDRMVPGPRPKGYDMTCRSSSVPTRLALSVMTAVAAVSLTALTRASASSPAVACRPWQALHTHGPDGQPYVVRNKPSINDNDEGMCVSVSGPGAFTVTRSPGGSASRKVRAYPYIGTGCFEGACASKPSGPMPRPGHWGTTPSSGRP